MRFFELCTSYRDIQDESEKQYDIRIWPLKEIKHVIINSDLRFIYINTFSLGSYKGNIVDFDLINFRRFLKKEQHLFKCKVWIYSDVE